MAYEGTLTINEDYDHSFYGTVSVIMFTVGHVGEIEYGEPYEMVPLVVFKVADRQEEVYAQTESLFRERLG